MMEKFIVSRDDGIYHAFPDLVKADENHLLCVFLECIAHTERFHSRVMITESFDRGRSWLPKRPVSEPGNGWNCPRITRLSSGEIIVICDRGAGERRMDRRFLFLWVGNDNEKTFSDAIELPIPGFVPDKLLELDGRWLIANQRYRDDGYLEQTLYISYDRGKTWSEPVIVGSKRGLNLCEASIISLPSGELVAFMRENSRMGWACFKSIS
ncbi:MAG: glycoside hydrolase [Candidatus Omnitrophica bacterium]|nr:glycoside hydrolase [Candidatus Omnitrophota bacterium]